MSEEKQKVIISLLVINILIICFFGITIKKQINRNNDLINNKFNSIEDSMGYLGNRISNEMINTLNERYNMIDDFSYSYANIDVDKNIAVLEFFINVKAINANSKIYLSYNAIDDKDIQEVELVKIKGLSYGANVQLDLNKNYQCNVIEKVDGGGEAVLNIATQNIYLYDEFHSRRIQKMGNGSGRNDLEMYSDFVFFINDFGLEKFGLDKAMLKIWYKDKLIDNIDVTDKIIFGSSGLIEEYDSAVTMGHIEMGTTLEEFKKIMGYQKSRDDEKEYYFYKHKIVYATDYPDLKLNRKTEQFLNFNLKIICRDGHTYEM